MRTFAECEIEMRSRRSDALDNSGDAEFIYDDPVLMNDCPEQACAPKIVLFGDREWWGKRASRMPAG